MTRSRALISLVALFVLVGSGPAFALSADSAARPAGETPSTPVAAPYNLAIRDMSWNGDPHAMPFGRAVLEADDQQTVWELAGVTTASASADGSTVALLTRDYDVFVSRLPEPPQRIDGGPYLSPALSADGTILVAQRLGKGGHILDKIFRTRGIALINLVSGEDRLLLEGNDLYSPSFASDQMLFFGSGGSDQIASLYLFDLASNRALRVTNREPGALQTFPSEVPRLAGGTIVYRADDESFRVAVPADDFVPVHRFDSPRFLAADGVSPDFGTVRIRMPNTQTNQSPKIYQYYDLDRGIGPVDDWTCAGYTYDQHQGTDFKQGIGLDVVAPASGRVILRYDGCPNNKQLGCGTGWGNFAAIQHTDGSVSLEAHGKNGTVAPLDAWLACGAKLMESASSGNSNAQHIHHESWLDKTGNVNKSLRYDPYQGSCDPSDPSKWGTQNAYKALPGATCTH